MLLAKLEHAKGQMAMGPTMEKAMRFLLDPLSMKLAEGRYEIDGELVYATVQSYETRREEHPRYESHRKYVDLQYGLEGEELILWAPLESLDFVDDYDAAKDVRHGTAPEGTGSPVRLGPGDLLVLHPSDAHATKLSAEGKGRVRKIVVKVAV